MGVGPCWVLLPEVFTKEEYFASSFTLFVIEFILFHYMEIRRWHDIKNPGRLTMLAFLGFIVQHNVTGKRPFDNLLQHLSDPWNNTIVQTLGGN
ncbi:Chlorophyll a/b binding domain superfamily [Sesbania bispinosa]|nr:Chlorophyll a/b binding domain superfamily [Sesbania bispinosa]